MLVKHKENIFWEYKLTVLDGDFAISVLCTQNGLIGTPLLDDSANCALAVRAVVGRILTQLQSRLISFRIREINKNKKILVESALLYVCAAYKIKTTQSAED